MKLMIESDVEEFIRRLPDLEQSPPTVHLQMLACRSKKARERLAIKIKDLVVERSVIRPYSDWREKYYQNLYNLALCQHEGIYTYKKESTQEVVVLPKTVMGLYATIGPRSVKNAVLELLKNTVANYGGVSKEILLDLLAKFLEDIQNLPKEAIILQLKDLIARATESGVDRDIFLSRTDVNYFSNLHAHRAGHAFFTFDQDNDDLEVKKVIDDYLSVLSPKAIWMQTETSGGFHTILDLQNPKDAETLYKPPEGILHQLTLKYKTVPRTEKDNLLTFPTSTNMSSKTILEYQRDSQEPIPGTLYCRNINHPKGEEFFVKILR